MGAPAIIVEDLKKTFLVRQKEPGVWGSVKALFHPAQAQVHAVRGVSFSVERGEVLGFIGPNGAGKSTTIKMLTGILHPSAGDARVLGLCPWRDRQRLAFRIGCVFGQKSQLWYHLPPADTFDLLARIYEVPSAQYRRRRDWLVELFEIGEFLRTPVRKLSLGQRMRCEIAAALLHCPQVLFLDEPTIGLDVIARQQIRDLISVLNREEGTTVFLTSHDVGDIERLCKRVIIVNHGEVVMDDRLSTLRHRYLRHKIIDLKLAEEAPPPRVPGVEVLKSSSYGLKMRVDTAAVAIEAVVAEIMARYRVADITITDPPMEEIIAAIYRESGCAEGGGGGEVAGHA